MGPHATLSGPIFFPCHCAARVGRRALEILFATYIKRMVLPVDREKKKKEKYVDLGWSTRIIYLLIELPEL